MVTDATQHSGPGGYQTQTAYIFSRRGVSPGDPRNIFTISEVIRVIGPRGSGYRVLRVNKIATLDIRSAANLGLVETATIFELMDAANREAAEHVLDIANLTIPYDTGFLHDSGQVVRDPDGSGWTVEYTAPYAEIQHESDHYQHGPGQRARWLELTIQEEADTIAGIYESYLGALWDGEGGISGRLQGFDGRSRFVAPPRSVF